MREQRTGDVLASLFVVDAPFFIAFDNDGTQPIRTVVTAEKRTQYGFDILYGERRIVMHEDRRVRGR